MIQEILNFTTSSAKSESLLHYFGQSVFNFFAPFLIGFKRSLEGLAIFPQYRSAVYLTESIDWRIYAWILLFASYELQLAIAYFGLFHFIPLLEMGGLVWFAMMTTRKIVRKNSKPKYEDFGISGRSIDAELAEIRGLMEDAPVMGSWDVL